MRNYWPDIRQCETIGRMFGNTKLLAGYPAMRNYLPDIRQCETIGRISGLANQYPVPNIHVPGTDQGQHCRILECRGYHNLPPGAKLT